MGIGEERERKKEKAMFEEIMTENFSKFSVRHKT